MYHSFVYLINVALKKIMVLTELNQFKNFKDNYGLVFKNRFYYYFYSFSICLCHLDYFFCESNDSMIIFFRVIIKTNLNSIS